MKLLIQFGSFFKLPPFSSPSPHAPPPSPSAPYTTNSGSDSPCSSYKPRPSQTHSYNDAAGSTHSAMKSSDLSPFCIPPFHEYPNPGPDGYHAAEYFYTLPFPASPRSASENL